MKRKLMIVIEEDGTNGGKGFRVYMAGDKERLQKGTPEDQLSPAEFWGLKLFQICVNAINKAGALQTVTSMPGSKDEVH